MLDDHPPTADTEDVSSKGYAQKILFFFCRKCGDYHEKTHPHYKAQKQRSYRRRKAKEKASTGGGCTTNAGVDKGVSGGQDNSAPAL